MLALLLGSGAIYLILGDLKEAIILLTFASLSVVITVIQEARTERVLEALRDLTRGLFPTQLARSGLEPALRSALRRTGQAGALRLDQDVARRRFPAPLRGDVELILGEPIRFDADMDHAMATTQLEAAVEAL